MPFYGQINRTKASTATANFLTLYELLGAPLFTASVLRGMGRRGRFNSIMLRLKLRIDLFNIYVPLFAVLNEHESYVDWFVCARSFSVNIEVTK